ncbi:hypothetical protein [Kitasatospora terrestris]
MVLAGTCTISGTAHASSTIAPITASGFKLTLDSSSTSDISAGEAANGSLNPVSLSSVPAGSFSSGKDGLCYPTPFNPGVSADGYCWGNTADDSGSAGWYPQGFSVPHSAAADGAWGGRRWEVVSWHNGDNSVAKLRFVDRASATPRYVDVLLATLAQDGTVTPLPIHADSVVWYDNNLLIGTGGLVQVFRLGDLMHSSVGLAGTGFTYVLPRAYLYRTVATATSACVPETGNTPCLTSLSFDRANGALLSSEFRPDNANGRIIRWSFDLSSGLPRTGTSALGAWTTPVWKMQGVVNVNAPSTSARPAPAASTTDTGRARACTRARLAVPRVS